MDNNFEKICPNCGATFGDEDVFCKSCGAKREIIQEQSSIVDELNVNPVDDKESKEEIIQEQSTTEDELNVNSVGKRKLNKKTIIIIASVVSLVAIFILYSGMPINQFKSALNSANIEKAIALYDENAGDSKFVTKAISVTENYIADVQKDYIDDITSYEKALNALTEIDGIAEVGVAKTFLKNLKKSKYFFTLAETAVAQKDYATALAYYDLVIEEDTSNYEKVQKIIPEIIELLRTTTLDSVNESIAKGNFAAAYKLLMGIDTNYTNDELKALLHEITPKANTEIENTAQTMLDNADYLGAYKYLEAFGTKLISNTAKKIMDSAYDAFATQTLIEAEKKALAGDYQEAATLLTAAARKINVTEFSAKAQEYQIEADRIDQKVFVVSYYTYGDISRKAVVVIKNNTDQVLKEYEVKLLLFDKNGYPVKSDIIGMAGDNLFSGWSTVVNIQPKSTGGNNRYWNINIGVAGTKVKACMYSAKFEDGTSWTNLNYKKWLKRERNQF
jgi:hypothetical protein